MTHLSYKSICTIAFLWLASFAFAGPEAEYKLLSKSWTLHADGSQEYHYTKELTLYTHTAMNGLYGESFILYNPEYQELKIHSSYTRQKDGNIVKTPENAFVEVLPQAAADAPAFNQLKEMVVVHTGLELGATIYLDYSIRSKPGYLPEIDLCETLEESSPVKDYQITLSVPEGKPLHYAITNLKTKEKTTVKDGMKQVSWKLTKRPASSKAPYVSVQAGYIPQLTASSFPSVKEAMEKLRLQYGRTRDLRIPALSKQLTQAAKNDTEKLQALLSYVVDEVDHIPLSLKETGFRIRPELALLTSAYGTPAEKAGLLAGLLKASGFDAKIAAVFATTAPVNSLGLSAANEWVVFVAADGKEYTLSPMSKSMANAAWYLSYETVVDLATGEKISMNRPSHAIAYSADLTVSGEKAEANINATIGNGFLPYVGTANRLVQGGKEIKLTQGKENGNLSYQLTQPLKGENGYTFLSLPTTSAGIINSHYDYLNTKRTDHLLLPCAADEQYHYTITIQDGWEISSGGTQNITLDNKAGQLTIRFVQSGNKIEIDRRLSLKKQLVTPAEYDDFRRLMTTWSDPNYTRLLLKSI